ncbi:MAG: tyrosine-type recombinase/integrase [Oscillospiraceae bacterium]|nr:tyrosine-type recombinase/integrase [Oscillospiraceae bacterium]
MADLKKEIAAYLDHCKHHKKLNAKTIKAYSIDLAQFRIHIKEVEKRVTKSEISGYIKHLHENYSPKSAKRKLASIKAFFNYLDFEERIDTNPIAKIRTKFQEPKVLPRTIPIKAIENILTTAYKNLDTAKTADEVRTAQRDIAIIELLFATGMRVSELCSLRLRDVNLDDGSIKIMGKGAKERIIQIGNDEVLEAIQQYKESFLVSINEVGFFFVNRRGLRLNEQSVRSMIRRLCIQADINIHITPHMFRHSFASLLLEEDVDIRYIQCMLGHSSIQTTQIYTQVTTEKQRRILSEKHPRNRFTHGT